MSTHDTQLPEGTAGFEPDHAPSSGITAVFVATVLILAVTFAGTAAIVHSWTAEFRSSPEGAGDRSQIEALRAHDSELLGSFAQVDAQRGAYRIPIDEAMKQVLGDQKLLGSLPKLLADGATPHDAGAAD